MLRIKYKLHHFVNIIFYFIIFIIGFVFGLLFKGGSIFEIFKEILYYFYF